MEIDEIETLKKVSEAVTEKPTTIDVDIKPNGKFHALLQRLKLSPSERSFKIKPQRVVNIYRIAGRAVSLDVGELLNDDEGYTVVERISDFMLFMSKHAEDVFYIVACVIQNNHKEPSKSLITFVANNFEVEDLLTVLHIGVSNYNLASFINSIALIKGVKTLNPKASPMKAGV